MLKKSKRIVCEINEREFKGGGSKSTCNSIRNMGNSSMSKKSSLISFHARATNDVRIYGKFKILITSFLFTVALSDMIPNIDCTNQYHRKSINHNKYRIFQSKNVSANHHNPSRNNAPVLLYSQQKPKNHAELIRTNLPNSIKRSFISMKNSLSIDDINNRFSQVILQPNDFNGLYVELHNENDAKQLIDVSRYGEISIPISKYGDRKERSFLFRDRLSASGGKKNLIQPVKDLPTGGRYVANPNRQYLPGGPPPFRPSSLMLGAASSGVVDILKQTTTFKRMYKSKAYYLFLDILRQLNLVAENISKKKMDLARVQFEAIQAIINKLTSKSKHFLKLKWPIVMLNPQFVRELMSSPTFLVMLFHAVEVAYMSMPGNFFLKPLVKLVAQPSPEKEEKIWWRRKRLYDTLNGHGSSELQPNLKTIHFQNYGEQTPIALPKIVNVFRKLTNRPPPNPATFKQHFIYPSGSIPRPVGTILNFDGNSIYDSNLYMNNLQEDAFLANQLKTGHPLDHKKSHDEESAPNSQIHLARGTILGQTIVKPVYSYDQINQTNHEEWLAHRLQPEQLMSQEEFDSLDPRDKERMMREIRSRYEESQWTNELIKQHSDFIDAFTNNPDTTVLESKAHNSIENGQVKVTGEID